MNNEHFGYAVPERLPWA